MVQEAAAKKALNYLLKIPKIYTPVVVFLAIRICLLPMLFAKTTFSVIGCIEP
jgi:Cd2+/Zn2+-exporting ATPase